MGSCSNRGAGRPWDRREAPQQPYACVASYRASRAIFRLSYGRIRSHLVTIKFRFYLLHASGSS